MSTKEKKRRAVRKLLTAIDRTLAAAEQVKVARRNLFRAAADEKGEAAR